MADPALPLRGLCIALVFASCAQVRAESIVSVAGTLTCTTSDTVADAALSCAFEGDKELAGNFLGYIERAGPADIAPGKRVLIWSVQSTATELVLEDIAGKYSGQTGGEPPGRLIGGKSGNIVLDPIDRTAEPGGGPVPTELELKLEATKA